MTDLRNRITRLAHENPGKIRDALMPILAGTSRRADDRTDANFTVSIKDLEKQVVKARASLKAYRDLAETMLGSKGFGLSQADKHLPDHDKEFTDFLANRERLLKEIKAEYKEWKAQKS
jgi:hypothetical protein